MARKCKDWLWTLLDYIEETETPRHFWLWAGISTIASALQRKVWLPFGRKPLYPNLYIMLVAPPGVCRKGAPLDFSGDILSDLEIPLFADSPTKRALTKSLDKIRKTQTFRMPDQYLPEGLSVSPIMQHSSMTVISKEFSSFLAVDPKAMIEALTDLFDSHDKWTYETSGEGTDSLHKVCLNALIATTPDWIANNLPEEAIGGGFTTRVVLVSGRDKYKWISLPPPPDESLYLSLRHDLKRIKSMVGEFSWGPDAVEYYDAWYKTIEAKTKNMSDRRLSGNLSRIHIMSLKTAMCIRMSYSDDLTITLEDLEKAIKMNEQVLATASEALSGHGRSRTSADVERICRQLRVHMELDFSELLEINFRDTNKPELMQVLETIEGMGRCKIEKTGDIFGNPIFSRIKWTGAASGTKGGKPKTMKKEDNPEVIQILNQSRGEEDETKKV